MKQRFLQEWQDLTGSLAARQFVLAISGGVDSVTLTHLLKEVGANFSLAHCNFNLRGPESDKDEAFIVSLANELALKLEVKSFETEAYAKEKGISLQMAARDLRYQWFDELLVNEKTFLLTAHHANDVAETMLFNLAKGTGLAGLHGIRRVDQQKIRPLLWASKEDILRFARENKLSWREDASNSSLKYSRNRLRNQVIPELEKLNPAFVTAAGRTAARITEAESLIDHYLASLALARREGRHMYIDKTKLSNLPGKATILYRLLGSFGFNYDQVEGILDSLDSVGATFLSATARLNIDRQDLLLSALPDDQVERQIDVDCQEFIFGDKQFQCHQYDGRDYAIQPGSSIAAFDWHKLDFPLVIRKYRRGERFQPLGMTGKKLISDFLIDEKVPVNLKTEQAVLVSGNQIIWVVGRRLDERFKLTKATKKVFEIRVENTGL